MTNFEFTDLCVEIDENYRMFTKEDFETIQIVYMYYPNIENKKDIAELYCKFGMTMINDMLPRALDVRDVEDAIYEQKKNLDKLQADLKALKGMD